jgi:hypothetical protein
MILTDLPIEILSMILLELQPNYTRIVDNFWFEESIQFPKQRYYNPQKGVEVELTEKNVWKNGYHKTIHTTYKMRSILLLISHVCQKFRRVALMHPFFSSLQLYRFLSKPKKTDICVRPILQLSQWIKTISNSVEGTRRLRTVILDPIVGKQKILAQDCKLILRKILNPDDVQDLILMLGWLALGDPIMIQEISRFNNVKRLYLKGEPDDTFHGFDNQAIRIFSKSFTCLTHLFIEGYGRGSYSWKIFKRLLEANPNIETLSIGFVRNEVELEDIGRVLPKLRVLTIQFDMYDFDSMQRFRSARSLTNRIVEPILKGGVKDIPSLETVYLYTFTLTEDSRTQIIESLLADVNYKNEHPKYSILK